MKFTKTKSLAVYVFSLILLTNFEAKAIYPNKVVAGKVNAAHKLVSNSASATNSQLLRPNSYKTNDKIKTSHINKKVRVMEAKNSNLSEKGETKQPKENQIKIEAKTTEVEIKNKIDALQAKEDKLEKIR